MKKYVIKKAKKTPKLGALWNASDWKNGQSLSIDNFLPESSEHRPETKTKLLYDEKGIHGFFMVKDKYIRCMHTEFQSPVCRDSCVEFFFQPIENKGYFNLHKVMNFGLKKCKGKYIARIDADDICYPNRLKVQYDYLEKNKDIYLIGSSAEVIDDEGNYLHKIKKKNYPSVFYKYHIAISNSFIHSSIMFRNEGHLYPSYNEHMFYCWLTYNKKRMKNIPDILVKYRINPKGMVAKYGGKTK